LDFLAFFWAFFFDAFWAAFLDFCAFFAAFLPAICWTGSFASQLAMAFRGVLSFWTAGEIPDRLFKKCARAAAATVLLGFVSRDDRIHLIGLLEDVPQS